MPTRRNRAPADALDDDIQPLGVSPATAQINQPRRRNPNNTGSRDIASRGRPATAQHTASTNQKKRKRPRDEITGPATDQETTTVDRTLRKPAEDRVSIGKMTCIICMEPYTNATMAAGCGSSAICYFSSFTNIFQVMYTAMNASQEHS